MIDADGSALLDFAHTMFEQHLSESVDACVRARRFSTDDRGQRENRAAMTSVIHAYAGLEAVANIFKFELFESEEGHFRQPVDDRDLALKELLANWDWVPIEKRYKFLLWKRLQTLDPSAANLLHDVRELRHLLAHGYARPALVLYGGEQDGNVRVVEVEVQERPRDRFPRLGSPRPDRLGHADARRVLDIVLRAVHQLACSFGHVLPLVSYEISAGRAFTIGGGGNDGPLDKLLASIDGAT